MDISIQLVFQGKGMRGEMKTVRDQVFILPNIPGQRYLFGSEYNGEKDNEEFIYFKHKDLIQPSHCVIEVDEHGKFWIQPASETAKVYYNKKIITDRQMLVSGCSFCMAEWEGVETWLFEVQERKLWGGKPFPRHPGDKVGVNTDPLWCELVLLNIFKNLTIPELMEARLICQAWNAEASKILSSNSKVTFEFGGDYLQPKNYTKVFRYLQEMVGLRPHLNLTFSHRADKLVIGQITNYFSALNTGSLLDVAKFLYSPPILAPNNEMRQYPLQTEKGNPGEKMPSDLNKLLTSHRFYSLALQLKVEEEEDFSQLQNILSLMGHLVELTLCLDPITFFETEGFESQINLGNLKTFRHFSDFNENDDESNEKCASFFTPLFRNSLTNFHASGEVVKYYLQEFLNANGMDNLRRISLQDICFSRIINLSQLTQPLSFLSLTELWELDDDEGEIQQFEFLLNRFAETLQYLKIDSIKIKNSSVKKRFHINFPTFPSLREMSLTISPFVRLSWGREETELLDLSEFLPKILTLKIIPSKQFSDFDVSNEERQESFDSFIPASNKPIKTLRKLTLPYLEKKEAEPVWYNLYLGRLKTLREACTNLNDIELSWNGESIFISKLIELELAEEASKVEKEDGIGKVLNTFKTGIFQKFGFK